MANRTTSAERLDREAAAARLEAVAASLRADECTVRVDNKDITLRPTDAIEFQLDVVEKQAMFREDRETVQIELDWRPE
ncbi:amphi-Trp domain-containing protein [Halobacterium hubeiense]|uniref:amphi-Trp domain-containing protein n=1 Tax=Halobacterium hubeiense TaxID=1407499 RepID=UPI003C71E718